MQVILKEVEEWWTSLTNEHLDELLQWTTEGKKLKVADQKRMIFNAKNIKDMPMRTIDSLCYFFKSNILLYDVVKIKGEGKNAYILLDCNFVGKIVLKIPDLIHSLFIMRIGT